MAMLPRGLRKFILISSTLLCVLIVAAFVVSSWVFSGSQKPSLSSLYAQLLVVAIPTLLVWWFWPKPVKPGHCRCGCDLRGNTSGVCPECGVEVQS